MEGIVKGAWKLEGECRGDLEVIGKRHTKAFLAAIERYRKEKRAKP